MRIRAQCIVARGKTLLLVQEADPKGTHWCLPGGGVDEGESPAAAAIRELREECGVRGRIVREVSVLFFEDGDQYHTFLVEIGEQAPLPPDDPEAREKSPSVLDVGWRALDQLSEKDRAFLWTAGLLAIPCFAQEALSWTREVSYPRSSAGS